MKHYIVINITTSMPRGFYLRVSGIPQSGDVVLLCLSEHWQEIGLENHYLEPGDGCSNSAPLIKRIIAIPGDNVNLSYKAIIINSSLYPYKTLYQDSQHRPLSSFPRGHYLDTKGYWVVGTCSQKSWDSRYWGPILPGQILSRLIPFITW